MKPAISLKSPSIMRAAVGCLLAVYVAQLYSYSSAFWDNSDSLLPITVLEVNSLLPSIFIHIYQISWWYHVATALLLVSALCIFAGYYHKPACITAFIMLHLIQQRNPYILQGGDDLLRILLLWLVFLPCTNFYSVRKESLQPWHYIVWTLYVLQTAFIYASSAWLKGAEWHTKLTAIEYVFAHGQIATVAAQSLLHYPNLLRVATLLVYVAEWLAPMLLILGIRYMQVRWIATCILFLFHLTNACLLKIGLFPWIGMVSLIGLIPLGSAIQINNQNCIRGVAWVFIPVFMLISAAYFLPANTAKSTAGKLLRNVGLYQRWDMFAPAVSKRFFRFVFLESEATLPLADTIATQPHEVLLSKDRFRKFSEYASNPTYSYLSFAFCNYIKHNYRIHPNAILYMIECENSIEHKQLQKQCLLIPLSGCNIK